MTIHHQIFPAVMLLLGMLFLGTQANAQPPLDRGRDPVFDARLALETSQNAIGRTLDHDYHLVDHTGQPFTFDKAKGKPLIISMVYTSCYHTCSVATRYLATVIDKARESLGEQNFLVVSIGFDTFVDTPKAMATFARQQELDKQPNWRFLSSTSEGITRLSHQLGFLFAPSPKGFDHLVQATVVDAQGVIYRQVYGETFQTPLLIEPLRTLILGTPPPVETPLEELVRRVRFYCTTYDPTRDRYRFDYSLFIGLFCGATVILATLFLLIREWRRAKKPPSA